MKVSVVVCTYSMERYDAFAECVESVLNQTYEPIELVLVIDGNDKLYEYVQQDFAEVTTEGQVTEVVFHNNEENRGISYSRTKGAELASGEIVAFIDDDAAAEPDWIERLVRVYEETDAIAVGGHIELDWMAEKPDFFPEEFAWLVGGTREGFAENMEEVRNTNGSNISYNRAVFLNVGGYDENTGRKGDKHIQAHEAPVCIRIREETGKGVIYNRDAVVHHKLFEYRGEFQWLVSRSFWQGYSKRIMSLLYEDTQGNEGEYLKDLAFRFVPKRISDLIRHPSLAKMQQLVAIIVFTAAVGLGYLYGFTQSKSDLVYEDADPQLV